MTDLTIPFPSEPSVSGTVEQRAVLGVPLSRLTMERAVNIVGTWVARGETRYISTCDVHCLMRAQTDPGLRQALANADIVAADGAPVAWTARMRFGPGIARVCGPDLMLELCARSSVTGWRHYFYGGAEGVAETLASELQRRYPGLEVAGTACPPFRELSQDERQAALDHIQQSKADIVWVGLGCPKQDAWMFENARKLEGVVSIGVGAAFDFHSGRVTRAPAWIRKAGFEWLHRLCSEPRRLWRRYLVLAPQFVLATLPETVVLGLRRKLKPRP